MSKPVHLKKRVTFWLAYPDTPKGGILRVLDEIESLGIDAGLSIRIGQAGRLENGVDEKMVQRCINRLGYTRIEVWWGSHPSTMQSEVLQAKRFHALGIRRFVANAETAWHIENANPLALQLTNLMFDGLPDSELGHAPFAMYQSHGIGKTAFPYLGFAKLHFAWNQLYPNEFGGDRAYWYERYEKELKAFRAANPILKNQKPIILADLYGSAFGRAWGLKGAVVPWADSHLDMHLALSEKLQETDIAFYSIDAALSESERPVNGQISQSNPWGGVKRWAEQFRQSAPVTLPSPAPDPTGYYDNKKAMCVDPNKHVSWDHEQANKLAGK